MVNGELLPEKYPRVPLPSCLWILPSVAKIFRVSDIPQETQTLENSCREGTEMIPCCQAQKQVKAGPERISGLSGLKWTKFLGKEVGLSIPVGMSG